MKCVFNIPEYEYEKPINKYNHDYFKNLIFFIVKGMRNIYLVNFGAKRKYLTYKFKLMLSVFFL